MMQKKQFNPPCGEHPRHARKKLRVHVRSGLDGQRGVASLVLAAMMLMLSGGLLGTYYVLNSQKTQVLEHQDQFDMLEEATASIDGFIAAYGRLPCPALTPNGVENCTSKEKGWFPTRTLAAYGVSGSYSSLVRVPLYMRYAASNLMRMSAMTRPADEYIPADAPSAYPMVQSSLDFCGALRWISSDGTVTPWSTGDGLNVNASDPATLHLPVNGKLINIVYAIAVAPPGTEDAAWGDIADEAIASLEGPTATPAGQFRSLVRYADAPSLYQKMSCPSALLSMDGMAMAATWSPAAADARTRLNKDAVSGTKVEGLASAVVFWDQASLTGFLRDAAYWATVAAGKVISPTGAAYVVFPLHVGAITADTMSAAILLAVISAGQFANLITMKAHENDANAVSVWNGVTPAIEKADQAGVNP